MGAGARRAQGPPGAEGPPGEASQPAASRWGVRGRGPGPMPSASGLSGSHHSAEPEADSHFPSPEPPDFQRRVALPGREPAPLRASSPDTSTNLARRRRDIYRVPPSRPPRRPGRNQTEGWGGAARRGPVAGSGRTGVQLRFTWTQSVP